MQQFADFIAPLSVERFRAEFYGKRPVHISGAGLNRRAPLDWRGLNEILDILPYWTEGTLKVFYNNRLALRENYCDAADLRPGALAPVNPAKVRTLLGLGATLVANHVHRLAPEVRRCVSMLEQEFAARAFANAYCSFKDVQAFQTHFDLHDVFAMQTEGEKLWRVYEQRADTPIAPVPPGDEAEKWLIESRGRLLFEVNMQPGDILYLPRGQYHDALTGAQASLHVTFGLSPANGLSLFKLLENAAKHERAFRDDLPDARDEAALQARLAVLAERVRAMLVSPAFAADVRNHQSGLVGALGDYALPQQTQASWYAVLRPVRIVRQDAGVAAICNGAQVALGGVSPAIEWAVQQRFFSMEDAAARQPGVDVGELRAALERLLAAGALEPTVLNR